MTTTDDLTNAQAELAEIIEESTILAAVRCSTCGMRADADPEFHSDRFAHWPTVRCQGCRSNIPFGGPNVCDRCDMAAQPRSLGGDLPQSRRCWRGQHGECRGSWTAYPDQSGPCECGCHA